MPELPKKKVGIVACSGEELPEGTVTRLAALRVLEQLRPGDTVTICLPLFLAGGEGDRAFARFYPTIAVDGCDKKCAGRATEMYSNRPAVNLVVTDLVAAEGLPRPQGRRQLDEAGLRAVDALAQRMAEVVDEVLGLPWSPREGRVGETPASAETTRLDQIACACGSGVPVQDIWVVGEKVTVVALPLIFQQLIEAGKSPAECTGREILETVQIYNQLPAGSEEAWASALRQAYAAFWKQQETRR